MKSLLKNQKGFTLIEVMMAMTIFAVFVTAIILSQSANVSTSIRIAEDLNLHNLAEMTINEVILTPPKFTNALKNDKKTKNYEIDGFKHYKYTIEYKKTKFPNFADLTGQSEDEDNSANNQAVEKLIFNKLKKNMELMLWQVKVTVTNTQTDYTYELTSWITNEKAKLDTNFTF